jgi:hypothetical protein
VLFLRKKTKDYSNLLLTVKIYKQPIHVPTRRIKKPVRITGLKCVNGQQVSIGMDRAVLALFARSDQFDVERLALDSGLVDEVTVKMWLSKSGGYYRVQDRLDGEIQREQF